MTQIEPVLYVALGASAGGLEPLEKFFKNMPQQSNMAFIVIQHLSPDYKSLMDEILGRCTSMGINKVQDAMEVQANNIYLIPAKKEMVIQSGRLKLRDKSKKDQLSMPIDIFLSSLAKDVGRKAVGIILSGSGSDGSRGVLDIKEFGGLVLVQNRSTAKFESMPQSAIDSGVADLVLDIEDMSGVLKEYANNPKKFRQKQALPQEVEGDLSGILTLLREKYTIDFNHYKPATIIRRIERRMGLSDFSDIQKYYELLDNDEGELNALYKDLLIGVTAFFRDSDAFSALSDLVLKELLTKNKTDGEVRIWVAGCATGEEVYSLAILVSEIMRMSKISVNVKFFATDVHRESLNTAAAGIYNESSLSNVSPEILERWFQNIDDANYQIHPDLRKMIVFAEHDLLKDPPFTNINLLTCRNLLIYMKPAAQRKIISFFHFALQMGGVLFLGPSETLGDLEPEFLIIEKHWKLFSKKNNNRLPAHLRFPLASTLGTSHFISPRQAGGALDIDQRLLRAYDTILDKYVSAGFLANQYHELVHTFGDSRQILLPPRGRATLEILSMVEGELKIALSAALQRAERERITVTYKGIATNIFPDAHYASVIVDPLPDKISDSMYFFIMLKPQETEKQEEGEDVLFDVGTESGQRIGDLEQEIQNLRENLQATVEELETSNEELQASNEELVASNEELQSTNEELHSVNEELYTVNTEYEQKIVELSQMTNDYDNLLNSTEIGTMFLDEKFCIRKYTTPVTDIFNVLPHDIGRPITHISNTIDIKNILPIIEEVYSTKRIHEKEVYNNDGNAFLMRILPYRDEAKVIVGIVLTFVDITLKKQTEVETLSLTEQLHHSHKMRAIGTLAGGIAHEFNNLLQAISGQMELLTLSENLPEEERSSVHDVLAMTGRATELVRGILTFSRRSDDSKDNVDLNNIVATTLKILKTTLPPHIDLQMRLNTNPVLIRADSAQIQQILFNLAVNSRDALKGVGKIIFDTDLIQIGEEEASRYSNIAPGNYGVLKVTDTGVGMPPDLASEIFDPFFTTKDVGKGTGMGLSITYGIVKDHKGHIECESSLGKGTTFTLFLPEAGEDTSAEAVVAETDSVHTKPSETVGGKTVLIVDDEPSIRKLGKRSLENVGFTVLTADSGENAIEQYMNHKEQIELVVLDLGMPGMGGEECIKELKKIDSSVKIIVASGYMSHDLMRDPQRFGAVKSINKPYEFSHLITAIEEALEP